MVRSILLIVSTLFVVQCTAQVEKVSTLKVTLLSTMLADDGIGEWGFCALIEFDGRKILFDTGARPETVANNAEELNIDLSDVREVFISHSHSDHTGGLLSLRRKLSLRNPQALSLVHIGEGAFYQRPDDKEFSDFLKKLKSDYEQTGGRFITYQNSKQIYPGVWITGPVPRTHDERNWSGSQTIMNSKGQLTEDNVPEDQSLVFNTSEGLIIISGCGHAGVINTIDYSKKLIQPLPVSTLIGGFHLFNLSDDKMRWTTSKLKDAGVKNFIGAHCTGINAVFTIQKDLELDRKHAVVGAVGASFELGKGIVAGRLAR